MAYGQLPMPVDPTCAAALRHATCALLTLDPDGRIETANPAAQALFALGETALVGKSLYELFAQSERAAFFSLAVGAKLSPAGAARSMGRPPTARRCPSPCTPSRSTRRSRTSSPSRATSPNKRDKPESCVAARPDSDCCCHGRRTCCSPRIKIFGTRSSSIRQVGWQPSI